MYEKLEECPVCNFTQFRNHLICIDHSISQESFALVQCTQCNHIFTNPRPDTGNIDKYYDSSTYISHDSNRFTPQVFAYRIARFFALRWKHSLVKSLHNRGKLLDFGSGTGHFLSFMEGKGWEVSGVEPSQTARDNSKQKSAIYPSLSELPKIKFDIVTAWHVLEHVHDIKGVLKSLKSVTKKNGRIIVAFPNPLSEDALHYREFWAGYDVPRHLHHFTEESFKRVCKKNKLKIEKRLPMKLDAYYVSLLSEKYLQSKNPLLRAMRMARSSNKAASKTGNFSSVIYILSK